MSMWMILDGVLLIVIAILVIVGVTRGFIKSVVRLVGSIAAVIASAIVSTPIAQWIYTEFFRAQMETMVAQKVQEAAVNAATSLNEQILTVTASLPDFIQHLMEMSGVQLDAVQGTTQSAQDLVPIMMDQLITPLCTTILQVVVFLVLFLVLFIAVQLLGTLLDKLFTAVEITKKINGLLGGVLGFAEGIVVVLVLCYGLQLYMTLTGAQSLVTMQDIEQTILVSRLMEVFPIFKM